MPYVYVLEAFAGNVNCLIMVSRFDILDVDKVTWFLLMNLQSW